MYGSSFGSPHSGATAVAVAIILVIAIAAVIALTAIGYTKFLGKNSERNSPWGKFFHFDHFYIEQVLRFLYLLCAVAIAVFCVAAIILSAFNGSFGSFFLSLLGFACLLVIGEFLLRISFEWTLIAVRQAVDVRALRCKVVGDVEPPDSSKGSAADFDQMFHRQNSRAEAPGQPTAGFGGYQPGPAGAPGSYAAPAGYAGAAGYSAPVSHVAPMDTTEPSAAQVASSAPVVTDVSTGYASPATHASAGSSEGYGDSAVANDAAMDQAPEASDSDRSPLSSHSEIQDSAADTWVCSCGNTARGNFCGRCGNPRSL